MNSDSNKNDMNNPTEALLLGKDVAYLRKDVEQVLSELRMINKSFDSKIEAMRKEFVSKQEFWPIKMVVLTFVGLILSSFVGGLIALVMAVKP